jgi:YfiH family protein
MLPPVPETFEWTQEPWGPALRCIPLGQAAPHLFTTRYLELSSKDDWHAVEASMGVRPGHLVTLAQVHGRDVVVVRKGSAPPEGRPPADVLISDDPDVALVVRAADCVPVLVADPQTGAVGAAHAGWRGTAAGAAGALVAAMARAFSSRPADLVAAIGPSIGVCCYEVGTDVVDTFAAAGHARYLIDRWFSMRRLPRDDARPAPEIADSTLRLDVAAANRDQLILAGLSEEHVHVSGLCTASNLELFPSYRAEGSRTGRILGVIKARDHS